MAKTKKAPAAPAVPAAITGALPASDDPFANDVFGGDVAPESEKKSKSSVPTINDDAAKAACEKFIQGQRDADDAKNKMDEARVTICPIAEKRRIELSRAKGEPLKSIKLNGVTCTVGRYKSIANTAENREKLKALFGADLAQFIKVSNGLAMRDEAMTKENIALLKQKLGDELYAKFFAPTTSIDMTDAFHSRRTLDPEVERKFESAKADGLIQVNNWTLK